MAMQPEYTNYESGYLVTTSDGVFSIPMSVVGPVKLGAAIDDAVRPYVTGTILEVRAIGPYYFARLTTPGCTDATEWLYDVSLFRLQQRLKDGE
jgi:hypothetical protein